MIQGALAVIRVIIWVWDPSWDDSRVEYESLLLSHDRLWDYDLTETRLVVLWASLHAESPAWLPLEYHPLSTQLGIPKWALPAFRPRNQNPEQMFELSRNLSRDNIEWDESLQVLQNAEDSWTMPQFLFMTWVFAWPNSDSSWVDSQGKFFSCRIFKAKQYENGVQRLHFLPCWDNGSIRSIPDEDGVRRTFGVGVFGVHSNRNRCVFALNEDPDFHTNSGGPLQHKLVVGLDTPVSELNPGTPADMLGESRVETIFRTMDMMWKTLDPILKAVQIRPRTPSSLAFPTELYAPTEPVRTSQQASPARSVASAPLPSADEEVLPDADFIRSQPRRRTN